ncbi:MAG: hypothetical protein P0S96_01755 [Simkaniaceae bacterium]|nr:hypothetical protein [Candidatus Sacchlamyda saccharinae]
MSTALPTTHYGWCSAAADHMKVASEERMFSRDLAARIHSIAEKTIMAVGLILACALVGTLLTTHFGTATIATVLEPVMLKTFQGIGLVMSIAVPTILYNVYQRSSHLSRARSEEQQAINANVRAAETPAWQKDYGWVTGLMGRLFSIGMYNTQKGSMSNVQVYQHHYIGNC